MTQNAVSFPDFVGITVMRMVELSVSSVLNWTTVNLLLHEVVSDIGFLPQIGPLPPPSESFPVPYSRLTSSLDTMDRVFK